MPGNNFKHVHVCSALLLDYISYENVFHPSPKTRMVFKSGLRRILGIRANFNSEIAKVIMRICRYRLK